MTEEPKQIRRPKFQQSHGDLAITGRDRALAKAHERSRTRGRQVVTQGLSGHDIWRVQDVR